MTYFSFIGVVVCVSALAVIIFIGDILAPAPYAMPICTALNAVVILAGVCFNVSKGHDQRIEKLEQRIKAQTELIEKLVKRVGIESQSEPEAAT